MTEANSVSEKWGTKDPTRWAISKITLGFKVTYRQDYSHCMLSEHIPAFAKLDGMENVLGNYYWNYTHIREASSSN
jgi:hypothetical protein